MASARPSHGFGRTWWAYSAILARCTRRAILAVLASWPSLARRARSARSTRRTWLFAYIVMAPGCLQEKQVIGSLTAINIPHLGCRAANTRKEKKKGTRRALCTVLAVLAVLAGRPILAVLAVRTWVSQ